MLKGDERAAVIKAVEHAAESAGVLKSDMESLLEKFYSLDKLAMKKAISKAYLSLQGVDDAMRIPMKPVVEYVFEGEDKDEVFDVLDYSDFTCTRHDQSTKQHPIFCLTTPFAGYRRGTEKNISTTHIFTKGIPLAVKKMEEKGSKPVVFDRGFVLFEHHMNADRSTETKYDMDNVETKKIVDALTVSFLKSDTASRLHTHYTAVLDDKQYTKIWITDVSQAAYLVDSYYRYVFCKR